MFPDLMVDLETLGTHDDGRFVILSVGMVAFDLGVVEQPHDIASNRCMHHFLSLEPQIEVNRKVDPNTVLWWLDQDARARNNLTEGQKHPRHIDGFFDDFRQFVNKHSCTLIWARGDGFDCKGLRTLANDFGHDFPFKYSRDRDMRTLQHIYEIEFGRFTMSSSAFTAGPDHDALADATHQVLASQRMFASITNAQKT